MLPPLTEEAKRRQARTAAAAEPARPVRQRAGPFARRALHHLGQRRPADAAAHLLRQLPDPQTGDYVIIRHELMHEARLIPSSGRASQPGVQYLYGDARGRWEGDTLVVDTTNFTDKTPFRGPPSNTRQDIRSSERLHVVERFTRVDADTIRYEFTVEDPGMWVAPWSGEMPIRKFEGPIYEYACHEGNYGLANILRAARVAERQAGGSR
jgi:hypothetical protein